MAELSAEDLFQHAGDELHLLREIVRTQQALMSAFSRAMGMPASRFAVMRALAGAPSGDLGVMELATQLGINAAAVTRQIKDMEGEHLVRRRADAKDGRRTYVSLSAKGAKLFEQLHRRSHDLERALVAAIGAEKMAVAADVLAQLRNFVGSLKRDDCTND
jgi:DNA-binding MarR family transcriptional regulator